MASHLIEAIHNAVNTNKGVTFITPDQNDDHLTYQELYEKALRTLAYLQQQGLKEKDELILQIEDNKQFLIVFWACILGAIIPVPLSVAKNQDQFLKLMNVWEKLDNPGIITRETHLNKVCDFVSQQFGVQLAHDIKIAFVDIASLPTDGNGGQIANIDPEDIAFIQFSSGSTGNPKGVVLTHENIITNVAAIARAANYSSDDAMLSWMPLTHDMGMIGFHLNPLFSRMDQCLMPTNLFLRRPEMWLQKADEKGTTVLCSPNFGYTYYLKHFDATKNEALDLSHVRIIYNGAEPISEAICKTFNEKLSGYGLKEVAICPVYGMAEATLAVTMSGIDDRVLSSEPDFDKNGDSSAGYSQSITNVGKPVDHCDIRITNNENQILTDGIIGQIEIKGRNVTQGYYNDEGRTRDILSVDGWLKTGDLGFICDGQLFVTGRIKDIIFINGQNYYPHDLEQTATEIEGIELNQIVIGSAYDKTTDSNETLAFVLHRGELKDFITKAQSIKTLLNHQAGIVIDRVLKVRNIPKTTSGKLQRFKLVEKYLNGAFVDQINEIRDLMNSDVNLIFSEPVNETEKQVLDIWRQVLKDDHIEIADKFLDIGGNSLRAAEISMLIFKHLGVNISPNSFFENPTVREQSIELLNEERSVCNTIPLVKSADQYPVSQAQKGIYYLCEINPSSTAYNIPVAFEIQSEFDPEYIEKRVSTLIARHDVLRMSFCNPDDPQFSIQDQVDFEIKYSQCSHQVLDDHLRALIRPFDLGQAPLLRLEIVETTDRKFLFMDFHHLISDGTSVAAFVRELFSMDEQESSGIERVGYKDYTSWEQDVHLRASHEEVPFWSQVLRGKLPKLELPYDHQRPALFDNNGGKIAFELDSQNSEALRHFAADNGHTMGSLMFALYRLLLYKLSYQEDVIIGIASSGRHLPELLNMQGMFVNNLPVRCEVDPNLTFIEWLKKVQNHWKEVLEHQDHSFENLTKQIEERRDLSRNAVFDTMFVYQNTEWQFDSHGIQLEHHFFDPKTAKYDLTLEIFDDQKALRYYLEYAEVLFEKSTVKLIGQYFNYLTEQIITKPSTKISDLVLVSNETYEQSVRQFNDTTAPFPGNRKITDLFTDQVLKTPGHVAISQEGSDLTYQDLSDFVDQTVYLLRKAGLKSDDLVALKLPRSPELIISILAILKLGGAYVPIDESTPEERISHIICDSQCDFALTLDECSTPNVLQTNQVSIGSGVFIWSTLNTVVSSHKTEELAYIIYTSGTSGKPKGVMIGHKSLINYSCWASSYYASGKPCSFPLFTSVSFDLTITSIFVPIISGGQMVIYNDEDMLSTFRMILTDDKVNAIKLTPSHLKIFNELALTSKRLKTVIVGGESLSFKLAKKTHDLLGKGVGIYNEYGPSEATVGCMIYEFNGSESTSSIPIGKPIQNTKIHLLDDFLKPVPLGVVGQIYICGEGLSQGYCLNPELTERKFLSHVFAEKIRIYATGDKGRFLLDGNVEFLGRADDQVKINGYRIELEEIAHHLTNHDKINESVVLAVGSEGDQYLVAYFVSGENVPTTELRDHLSLSLPAYMLPAQYVALEHFPITANGKLNKNELPVPDFDSKSDFVVPVTSIEKLLSNIWSDVLQQEQVGITSNFFWLGGDSIKAVQIVSRLRAAGYIIRAKDLFASPTILDLSVLVEPVSREKSQSPVSGIVPLTGIQRRFFNANLTDQHHHNQSVMLNFPDDISSAHINQVIVALRHHHDALRTHFTVRNGIVVQETTVPDEQTTLVEKDLRGVTDLNLKLTEIGEEMQSGMDLSAGPLIKAGFFKTDGGYLVLIIIHHLVVDGISWRILLEDIDTIYQQVKSDQPIKLPPKTEAFKLWSESLLGYQNTTSFEDAKTYWNSVLKMPHVAIPKNAHLPLRRVGEITRKKVSLDLEYTNKLLTDVHKAFNTEINDVLLTGFLTTIYKCFGIKQLRLDLEGHGREEVIENVDVNRTVGWFTSLFPVILHYEENKKFSETLIGVKETLRAVPNRGFDYLIVENQYNRMGGQDSHQSRICFNYLGQFDNVSYKSFHMSDAPMGNMRSPNQEQHYDWDIIGMISGGKLELELSYCNLEYSDDKIGEFMEQLRRNLIEVIDFCSNYGMPDLTPSDLSYKDLPMAILDELKAKYAIEDVYSLTPMQKTLHAHAIIHPDSLDYFEQLSFRWRGDLDISRMQKVLTALANRHPVLRTLFYDQNQDETLQIVLIGREIDFEYQDVREEVLRGTVEGTIDRYRKSDRDKLFNVSEDVLMRVYLYKLAEEDYLFLWSFHHIIMDGWSTGILLNDFRSLYESLHLGISSDLAVAKPYSKYINWLEGIEVEASAAYWKEYLVGYDQPATFSPLLETGQSATKTYRSQRLVIETLGVQTLLSICGELQVTLSTVFQTLWGVLLSRYNDSNDVVFGNVTSGRPPELSGVEYILGLFINTLPVRVKYDEECTVQELLVQQQNFALDSEFHGYFGLSDIQATHELRRNLFDHIVVIENYPVDKFFREKTSGRAKKFELDEIEIFEQTNYNLSVTVFPGEQLEIVLEYNTELYTDLFIETLKHQIGNLLNDLPISLGNPVSRMNIMTEKERHCLLNVFNRTDVDYPRDKSIIDLFEARVMQYPDHTAIDFQGRQLTYQELNIRANRLGHFLQKQGVGRNQLVGLILDESLDMIVSIMGVLKSGAAYLPIDPNYPSSRIQYMLENSQTRFVLMGEEYLNEFDEKQEGRKYWSVSNEEISISPGGNPMGTTDPDDLAYVIYTSGTTGNPKGAMIEHGNVVRLLFNDNNLFDFNESDTWTKFHSFSFDFSVWEIFGALLNGGKLVLITKQEARDPRLFLDILQDHQVTILNQTPSAFQNLLSEVNDSRQLNLNLRMVIFGGEKLTPITVRPWRERFPEVRLINMYGITETTVHVTYKEVTDSMLSEEVSNIGLPIPTTQVYILDKNCALAPIGVMGELYVGGDGVCRGYLNNEELTKHRFVENPFNKKERLYRTGDLAYWLPEGELVYVGRMDDQVQIRGFRVELGEIVQKISTYPLVRDAVVLYNEEGRGDLIAYYLSEDEVKNDDIRIFLADLLPVYMIPQYFLHLTEFPLTPNGKVDTSKLPIPMVKRNDGFITPRNELECRLSEIWQELLHVDQVGIGDSFFELGGHSLKVTQLVREISKEFNVQIPHKEIFQRSTIEDLSMMIEAMKSFGDSDFGTDDPEIEEISI